MPKVTSLDMGNLCRDCGTDTSKFGFVNRVPSDVYLETKAPRRGYNVELYFCGSCNDMFESSYETLFPNEQPHQLSNCVFYKKQIDRWIKDVDKKFPDAEKFRAYVQKGTKSKLTDKDIGDLLALIKNYSNPGNEGPADLTLAFNDPEAYHKQEAKEGR